MNDFVSLTDRFGFTFPDKTPEDLRKIAQLPAISNDVLMYDESGNFTSTYLNLSVEEAIAFTANATPFEKRFSRPAGGNGQWKLIIDVAGTIVAYSRLESNVGVYHFFIRDIDGNEIFHRIVGEKPLQDSIGNDVLAVLVTMGGALFVRAVATGITKVAAAGIAAGIRSATIALSRLAAGEATEGVVLTALRSIRAQSLVKQIAKRGLKVIVNIGGEAGKDELAQFGEHIALNHQVRMSITKRFIPNLVKENGERIGEMFERESIDRIVSRRLDANFDVKKVADGAFRVLKPGGTVDMQLFSNNPAFAESFKAALRNAGFRDVSDIGGAVFKAVK